MVIYKQVNLDFDYTETYDFVKSIEKGELVLDPMNYLDQELQNVQAFLRDASFFDPHDKVPTRKQKQQWSKKICFQIMNS